MSITFGILLLAMLLAAFVPLAHWNISDDYSIKFSGSGAEGTSHGLEGFILFDPENPSHGKFDVRVKASTISTGNKTKDKHAGGKSWLDVENYPSIKFTSTRVTKPDRRYAVTGVLELHGVTKKITIPFSFSPSGDTAVFKVTFTLNRKDFDINGPSFAFLVADAFEITLKIPVYSPQ